MTAMLISASRPLTTREASSKAVSGPATPSSAEVASVSMRSRIAVLAVEVLHQARLGEPGRRTRGRRSVACWPASISGGTNSSAAPATTAGAAGGRRAGSPPARRSRSRCCRRLTSGLIATARKARDRDPGDDPARQPHEVARAARPTPSTATTRRMARVDGPVGGHPRLVSRSAPASPRASVHGTVQDGDPGRSAMAKASSATRSTSAELERMQPSWSTCRRPCATRACASPSSSRGATRRARAARSPASPRGSTRAATTSSPSGVPTERERGQWYFQRYVDRLPVGGRDRPLRPQLVQPRRRRAGHGLLHDEQTAGLPAGRARPRADARRATA